ncbi:kelch repeat and BTB domain-containing protein 4 [Elysia marginata]|uniref:Kelch repeat and BTB domain-containing protein 4 n=1 Tax=Elysia marginata TaxID=1093978 RepID=A0AAV4FH11_9GAST|nr:kelch repeat and BTB domain-containing protein 4 [Elysia marginata]
MSKESFNNGQTASLSSDKSFMKRDWRRDYGKAEKIAEAVTADITADTTCLQDKTVNAPRVFPTTNHNDSSSINNNINNNNNNSVSQITKPKDDKICKIEVVRSCRRADKDSATAVNEGYPSGGINNNNNINCSQLSMQHRVEKTEFRPEALDTKHPTGDSSNNNKAMSSTNSDVPCIVDNLVMETEKVTPNSASIEATNQEWKSKPVSPGRDPLTPEVNNSAAAQEMTFTDPRQSQVFQMLTGLQQLRKDTEFTDITVRVQDAEYRCHSFVLALSSPYLRALVKDCGLHDTETKFRELQIADATDTTKRCSPAERAETDEKGDEDISGKDQQNEEKSTKGNYPSKLTQTSLTQDGVTSRGEVDKMVTLKGVEPGLFSKMLDFMHCCFEDVLTEANCLEMLLASSTVQLPHLRRACATFVTDTLSAGNVYRVMQLCDSGYSSLFEPRIMKKAHQVIRENFPQLCLADEFLRLGRHVMIPLLADSMLHTRSEMEVLHALISNLDYNERMAWPRHNSISRCLFSTRDLILWTADRDKGLHFYSIIDGQHHKVTSFGQLTAPQHTSSTTTTSGASAATGSGNFSFDSTSSVCCYGDKIFFTGGEFNTDMVWSVDTGSGEVKVHSKMPRGRKFHSMVASKGCVYCLGGQDKRGYTVLEDVDAYIINKDMWVKVGHLAVPAYNMSAAVCGGAVYLVGGLDHAGQPLRIIQCFIALRSGLYSAFKVEVSNMPPSLLSARAVACGLEKTIYIVCGHGEVYQFEPERQCLSPVTTLKNLSENPRVRFGLAYVGGCLVVIGGHRLGLVMHEPIRSVCLDIASKTEVRDYSPMLPGDIVNTCLAAKLSSNILRLFNE